MDLHNEPSMDTVFLSKLKDTVLKNLSNEQFGVEELSDQVGISRSQLHRRLKKLIGKSVSQFIREVRLEEAMKLLRNKVATTSEIAYRVGFGSPSYFYKCFQDHFGYRPGEIKNQNTSQEGSYAPAEELNFEQKDEDSKNETKPKRKVAVLASTIVFLLLAGVSLFYVLRKNKEDVLEERSIAVLPFTNLSADKENQYFADGIVEDLLNRLSRVKDFKVISRTSSDAYRERESKTLPQIAAELGVSYIVEGSIQRYSGKARITVQLIDAQQDYHLWAQSYDRDISDIFRVQSEIAVQIATALSSVLTSEQILKVGDSKTENIKAYENYQLGRYHWNKRTEEGFLKSIDYYQRAIAEDPEYGLAYAGLADTYNLMTLYRLIPKSEGRDKTVELALKALELDENLAEAYTALGSIYDYIDWDWPNAERAFKRAIEINPNFSTAHHYYSEDLSMQERHEEARHHIDRAMELDPLSFIIRIVSTKLYYNRGLFENALSDAQKSLELHEGHPMGYYALFEAYWQLGEYERSFEALMKCFNAADPMASPWITTTYYDVKAAEEVYSKSGLKGVILWMIALASQSEENAYFIANLCGMIGENEQAVKWLEKAYNLRLTHIAEMGFNIHFEDLHLHPGFIALLKNTNMYSYHMKDRSAN